MAKSFFKLNLRHCGGLLRPGTIIMVSNQCKKSIDSRAIIDTRDQYNMRSIIL